MNRTTGGALLPQSAGGRQALTHPSARLRRRATKGAPSPQTTARLELELALAGDPLAEVHAYALARAGWEVAA